MKKEKLNESAEAGVIFISLGPDDYHGAPEVDTIFPSTDSHSEFPTIPDKEWVFRTWLESGYNSFNQGDWDGDIDNEEEVEEGKKEYFELYGDLPLYYATYMIVMNNESNQKAIIEAINNDVQDLVYSDFEDKLNPDDFVNILNDIKGIESACVLTR